MLIANILANKLKLLIDKIIFTYQNAIIHEIKIMDAVLIANECLTAGLRPVVLEYVQN